MKGSLFFAFVTCGQNKANRAQSIGPSDEQKKRKNQNNNNPSRIPLRTHAQVTSGGQEDPCSSFLISHPSAAVSKKTKNKRLVSIKATHSARVQSVHEASVNINRAGPGGRPVLRDACVIYYP